MICLWLNVAKLSLQMKGSTSQAKLDQKEERKTRRVGVVGDYVFFGNMKCVVLVCL
jgi:hypothetical protein